MSPAGNLQFSDEPDSLFGLYSRLPAHGRLSLLKVGKQAAAQSGMLRLLLQSLRHALVEHHALLKAGLVHGEGWR